MFIKFTGTYPERFAFLKFVKSNFNVTYISKLSCKSRYDKIKTFYINADLKALENENENN